MFSSVISDLATGIDDGTQSLSMASMAGTGDLTFRGPAAAAAAAAATISNPLSISVEHLGAESLAAMLIKGGCYR